jgi:Thiamine pyrophosphate enzyme, N-terminal TPP binding domain
VALPLEETMSTLGEAKAKEKHETAGRLLIRSLVQQNVKYIFGIPGGKIMPTFDVLRDEGPKLIVCRHEQNAAFMAAIPPIPRKRVNRHLAFLRSF